MGCDQCGHKRYAEWCPYCDTETPKLSLLYQSREEIRQKMPSQKQRAGRKIVYEKTDEVR